MKKLYKFILLLLLLVLLFWLYLLTPMDFDLRVTKKVKKELFDVCPQYISLKNAPYSSKNKVNIVNKISAQRLKERNFDDYASILILAKKLNGDTSDNSYLAILDKWENPYFDTQNSWFSAYVESKNKVLFYEINIQKKGVFANMFCRYSPDGNLLETSYSDNSDYFTFDTKKRLTFYCNRYGQCNKVRESSFSKT